MSNKWIAEGMAYYEVCVNNVGQLGCDIIQAVDSWGESGKNYQKLTLEGSSRKQGWNSMCDISHAIYAECGNTHKIGK